MSDGLETCRKVTAIVGALLAMGIAIPFTVVYANQYHELRSNQAEYSCIAVQTIGNSTNTIDVTERFLMVMRFGYIYYLIATICLIFSFLSALHPVVGAINALFQSCCVAIPGTALVIVVGVYRFSWSGSACSYPGAKLQSQGLFLKNMFIAQLVLQAFILCCAGSGTSVKRK